MLFCDLRQYPVSTDVVVVSLSFPLSSDDELLTLIFVVASTVAEDVAFAVAVDDDETFLMLPAGALLFVVFCF